MMKIQMPDKKTVDSIHTTVTEINSTVAEVNEKIEQIAASTDTYWCGTAAGGGDTFILTTDKNLTELIAGQKFTFFTDRYSDEPWIKVDSCPPYMLNAKIRGMGVMIMAFADHHFYCETAQIHDDLSSMASTMKNVSDNMALVKSSTLTTSVTLEDTNTKVGDPADDAGSTSIFARLKQIYNHLTLNLSATRAGYIDAINTNTAATKTTTDTLNTKMGTNTDSGGNTTLFARMNQISAYQTTNLSTTRASYIDTINSNTATIKTTTDTLNTKIGTNTDSAGNTTLFSRVNQINTYLTTNLSATRAGYIDTINYQC